MSVLGTIFAILGFLIGPFGIFSMLMGFVVFFSLPVISKATSYKKPARLFLWLAKQPINRAAIVVSELNDIVFKQTAYDPLGVEAITLDGETKAFEDPDDASHYWMGIRFALADEKHGVLFDTRHPALGQRKHDSDERDESNYDATAEEWEDYDITEWHKGVFEMPKKYELVDLSRVRELVDGGERSEYAKRVEQLYRHSRDPFNSGASISKFFYPIAGFCMVFFGIWLMASQFGGGSSPTSSVSFGLLMLLLSPSSVDWKELGKVLGMVVGPLLPLIGIAIFVNPIVALGVAIAFGIGFLAIPILSQMGRAVGPIGGAFSKIFFRLGFMGYDKPVFVWTPDEYILREYDELGEVADVTWYGLFGSKVGFTHVPDPDSWGAETMTHDELESMQEVPEDETNLPKKYVRTSKLKRDSYGGFIPKRIKKTKYYLHSGIATARFNYSAVGEKSLKRLLQAKEEFGEQDSNMSDSLVFKTTAVAGLFGAILGVLFFVL